MGFVGSTPAPLRTFLADIASTVLAGRKIYLGCSGNFTIESILSKTCPSAILHSNDVSLYSSAIGYMLTGRQLDLMLGGETRWGVSADPSATMPSGISSIWPPK